MSQSKWWLPPRWFTFLAICYACGIFLFAILRLVFLLTNLESAADASIADILTAFGVGIRFDQIVILTFLIPITLTLPWFAGHYAILRRSVATYFAIVTALVIFGTAADIRFFHYMDSHLNFLALEYLGEGAMAGNLVIGDPWFWPAIIISVVVAFFVFMFVQRTYSNLLLHKVTHQWFKNVAYFILAAIVTFLGIRGRTDISPIDWGAAYFSENHFVNQLALNGLYTFGRTLVETNQDPRLSYMTEDQRFPFVPFDVALTGVQQMLVQPNETLLQPDSSLLRDVTQPPSRDYDPNIVLVIMESWSGRMTGALGDTRNLTPHFDSLVDHGTLFTNFYASGTRTGFGLGAILCSFPSVPGRSITNRYDADHPFITLPEILASRGYYNSFVYGGDLVFDNVEGFFKQKGMNRFIGQDDFPTDKYFSKWGVPDHELFNRIVSLTDSLARPFSITALTLSNHEPFDLPDSSVQRYFDDSDTSKEFNAQFYADQSIGHFMTAMKQLPVYDSTIFVFTSDHARIFPRYIIVDPRMFHIPLLIIDGARDTIAQRVDIFGDQTDIIPTLMGVIGGDYRHASWGQNLLALDSTDANFAILNLLPWIAIIQDGFIYTELPSRDSLLYDLSDLESARDVKSLHPDLFLRLQHKCRLYVQLAEQLSTPTGRR